MMSFVATRMQLEMITLSEASQKEKDKYHMVSLMCNLQYDTSELSCKTDSRTQRTDLCRQGERGGERWRGRLGLRILTLTPKKQPGEGGTRGAEAELAVPFHRLSGVRTLE